MENRRIKKLQESLKYPLLVKKKENLAYLTGRAFGAEGDGYLLVGRRAVVGFGSGLEKIHWVKKTDRLKNIRKHVAGRRLDIERIFTYAEGEYLKAKAPGLKIVPGKSRVDVLRQFKEPRELILLSRSMQIVAEVFRLVRKEIRRPGMTESKISEFIRRQGLRLGAEDVSFPPIVAAGANSAVPHHVPGKFRLKRNQPIILDFGFKRKSYCSDFTRTVFLRSAPPRLAAAYHQVEKAYLKSMAGVRAGKTTGGRAYKTAVEALAEKKLDRYFIHSLGHGSGLEIHELPNLSPHSKDILENGMVFSIEPGVYLPSLGGIRIEDLVYLNRGKITKFIDVSTKLSDNIL